MSTLSIMYPDIIDIGCFSHTLDLVGTKFNFSSGKIHEALGSYFHTQLQVKANLKREQTGMAIKTYSPTRWWSCLEYIKQVMDLWGDVPTFLANPVIAPKSKEKLQLLLHTKGK